MGFVRDAVMNVGHGGQFIRLSTNHGANVQHEKGLNVAHFTLPNESFILVPNMC